MTFKSPFLLFCTASLVPGSIHAVPVLLTTGADTWLNAVSADGTTACGAKESTTGTAAIRWTAAGGVQSLAAQVVGPDKKPYSEGFATSTNGSIIVGKTLYYPGTSGGFYASRWDSTGAISTMALLTPSGAYPYATASGISGNGAIAVGTSNSSGGLKSFKNILATDTTSNLGDVTTGGAHTSAASAISNDGTTIVGYRIFSPTNQQATYKKGNGATVNIGDLPGGDVASFAKACSTDGTVIVGEGSVEGNALRGFRWTAAGGMTLLNALPNSILDVTIHSTALGVSGNGDVSVGFSSVISNVVPPGSETPVPVSSDTAVIWYNSSTPKSIKTLLTNKGIDTSGWNFRQATGISASGNVIVGRGTKNNVTQGFVIMNAMDLFADTNLRIPMLTISKTSYYVTMQYTTQPGFRYQLEKSITDLSAGAWVPFAPELSTEFATGNSVQSVSDFSVNTTTGTPEKVFYRVRVKSLTP